MSTRWRFAPPGVRCDVPFTAVCGGVFRYRYKHHGWQGKLFYRCRNLLGRSNFAEVGVGESPRGRPPLEPKTTRYWRRVYQRLIGFSQMDCCSGQSREGNLSVYIYDRVRLRLTSRCFARVGAGSRWEGSGCHNNSSSRTPPILGVDWHFVCYSRSGTPRSRKLRRGTGP